MRVMKRGRQTRSCAASEPRMSRSSAAQSDTSISLPTVTGICVGNQRVGSRALNGGVRALYYRKIKHPAGNVVALSGGNPATHGDRALISGTPTVASSQTVLLSAANDVGSDDAALTLIINPVAASGTGGGWSKWLVR
jgi:hypothetical protein